MNPLTDQIKQQQLRRHKAIATGLFLLMVALYVVSTWALKTRDEIWLGYVKAFSEAAMIGALADWFAVTALFYHPLGIPIPHTNLIENRKKSIGNNLGGFVVQNFLNAATIRPYIAKLNTSSVLTQWLDQPKNTELLASAISRLLKDIIQTADQKIVTDFITARSKAVLNEVKLNEVLASGLDIIVERGDQVRILNYLVARLRHYVIANEPMVRERVKKESHFLIPGFVDQIIAAKITNGLAHYLAEIEQDPNHKIRTELNEQLRQFIADIRTSPQWQQELKEVKELILTNERIESYALSIWKHVQGSIVNDLESGDSAIRQYVIKTITELTDHLKKDPALQQKLDGWVRHTAYKYVLRNTTTAGQLISETVGNWQGKELSNKLELEVGKDLQFIRINGTLVGGLVGLIIYTITRLIENS